MYLFLLDILGMYIMSKAAQMSLNITFHTWWYIISVEYLFVTWISLFKQEYLRWLDGDASLLFIFSGVSESGLSCTCRSDNASFTHQGISESRFAVVHMGDHRHIPDVGLFVHDLPNLVNREVHLWDKGKCWLWSKYECVCMCGTLMSKQMMETLRKIIWQSN